MKDHAASERRDAAAAWVARIDAGGWADADEAELQVWLEEDSLRRGALLQAQAAWMTLDKGEPDVAARTEPAGRISRRGLIAGGGAALAASVLGGVIWSRSNTSYVTAVGEIRRIPLADGSTAVINTATKLDIRFAEASREVRLRQGEAWFQVAKDPGRPFIVEAGNVRVVAVGTAFSVRRRDGRAEILVTEGVVEAWATGAEGHVIRLTAGQRALVADNAAISHEPSAPSSVDRALAWRGGKIVLVGDKLSDAVAEFNRYNQRQIVLVDPAITGEQFDGMFSTNDPEGFAIAVRSSLSVPVDLSQPGEIRVGRPRG